jgi:hypothetical protein
MDISLANNEYDNINIILKRNDEIYDKNGRLQDLHEAKEIDNEIKKTLDFNNIYYTEFFVGPKTAVEIFKYIVHTP